MKSEQRSFVIYRRNTYEQYGGYNLFQNAEFKANLKKMLTESCESRAVLNAILREEYLTSLVLTAEVNFFNFLKMIDGEILEVKQKMQASFRRLRGLGYLTVPEMLATMHENDLFDMSPVFCNAVHLIHILGVIPATLCSA